MKLVRCKLGEVPTHQFATYNNISLNRRPIFSYWPASKNNSIVLKQFRQFSYFRANYTSVKSKITMEDSKRIDGKKISEQIQQNLKIAVERLQNEKGITPGLAVVLVGSRKDSQTYVRQKKVCH
jgi:hypothetical protein